MPREADRRFSIVRWLKFQPKSQLQTLTLLWINSLFMCMLQRIFCDIGRTFSKLAELFLCTGQKIMSRPGNTGLFQPIRMKYCIEWEGRMDQWLSNKRIFWVIFHPGKAQKAQERCMCPKVRGLQNSDLNAVGWNNICIRPDSFFVNLWGACDSSVLQCITKALAMSDFQAKNVLIVIPGHVSVMGHDQWWAKLQL